MTTSAVYNVGMLPTEGLHDLSATLWDYHKTLVYELQILDGIRTGPLALPADLENELDSARYHLGMMIVIVEKGMRTSANDLSSQASSMPELQSAKSSYLSALLRAKACWNAWLNGTPVAFEGFGEDGTAVPTTAKQQEQAILDAGAAMASPKFSRSAIFLGVGLTAALIIYAFRR